MSEVIKRNDDGWFRDDEERALFELADRDEDEAFFERAARYTGGGWLVPYLRHCSLNRRTATEEEIEATDNAYYSVRDEMRAAAEAGNGFAQFVEGNNTYNRKKAREWFHRSALTGCRFGQLFYARACLDKRYGPVNVEEAFRGYRGAAEKGMTEAYYPLAGMYTLGKGCEIDREAAARWLLAAAESGGEEAGEIVKAAGDNAPADRVFAEIFIRIGLLEIKDWEWYGPIVLNPPPKKEEPEEDTGGGIYFSVSGGRLGASENRWLKDAAWDALHVDAEKVRASLPETLPPASGRDVTLTPDLHRTEPSFAARLILYVRDRFGNDAPRVYQAARVSRQTYSSIVSNELRPVSKSTAIAFALALGLSEGEADELLKAAGYALSNFLLEDMIVRACIKADIRDIDRVNAILTDHGAKPL